MKNIVITGANRGLGLGFVKHYLGNGDRVWACHRADPGELESLDCTPVKWDVTQSPEPTELGKLPEQIDILINNAGVYGSRGDGQSLEKIKPSEMLEVFRVDAVAPLMVVQSLLPRLRRGKGVIANMSSKMGSNADNGSGGVYAYRSAKAALCIISRSMAVDLAGDDIDVICLHPGWVETDMTNHTGLIDIATSISGLASVIENVSNYPAGAFVAYDGKVVPW